MWKDNLVPYSFQKRDIYYFSRRVPKDLEDYYRASKITLSLRTKSPKLAKEKSASLASQLLVADLYNLGRMEEIKDFIGDRINNVDMKPMILWIYASMEQENGNTEKAREYFERGKNNGAREQWIFGTLRNKETTKKLTKYLKVLGPLD